MQLWNYGSAPFDRPESAFVAVAAILILVYMLKRPKQPPVDVYEVESYVMKKDGRIKSGPAKVKK